MLLRIGLTSASGPVRFHSPMIGQTISHYRIIEKLGSGGMGVVYKAEDTRLHRFVALKFLPEEVAQAPQTLARLRREAQAASALNHPNICQVYDVGENHLVMEYVEGEPVRAPDNTRNLLDIAIQIADGLAAAHVAGFIHRDLKPDNILVTKDGRVKILDFGLAKQMMAFGSNDATQTLTNPGTVVGTVAYMSPEQARGRELDWRSDQFAFGAVLYELACGKRAFQRDSAGETMTAIIREEPAPLPATVPAPLQWVIERCLAKEPGGRYESTRDLYHELKVLRDHLSQVTTPVVTAVPRSRGRWLVYAAALVVLAVFAGWWFRAQTQQESAGGVVQFQRITDFVGMEESPAISPDGKTVAFVAWFGNRRQVWVRLLAGGLPLQITRDDADHENPRWSPDSSSLIYYSPSVKMGEQGTIWEISALGGSPRRIGSALGGGDVSHDGRHIAAFQMRGGRTELILMTRDGSASEPVTQLDEQHPYDEPRWSPDDRWIAFHRGVGYAFDEGICVVQSSGGELRELFRGDSLKGLAWLPDGSGLVYGSSFGSTVLYPPTYNLRTVRMDGGGVRQLTFGDVSYVEPDVHSSGKLVASRIRLQSDIWKFPVGGSPAENTKGAIRITSQTGQIQTPSVSRDGSELVYLSDSGGHGNLWVTKTDGSSVRQITFEQDPVTVVGVPVWSPVGDRIAFILTRKGETGLWLVNPDGSGLRQLVAHGSGAAWSADGQWLYYSVSTKSEFCTEKVPVNGGTAVTVRCENSGPVSLALDSTLYYFHQLKGSNGGWDYEILRAHPETASSQLLARVDGDRIPVAAALFQPILSPDGRILVVPLLDGATSNLWAIPTEGGAMRRLTDFGQRPIAITRRVSWSPDSRYIFAAVGEMDADIVMLDGLIR
jgi:Tol biopolymer transport system component/predicted Ser/Thr protein kinase